MSDEQVEEAVVQAVSEAEEAVEEAVDQAASEAEAADEQTAGEAKAVDEAVDEAAEDAVEPEPADVGGPTLAAALEAVLLVADEPVAPVTLAQVVRRPVPEVEEALLALAEDYTAAGRGFDLREVAGGWRYYTREDCHTVVERFVLDGQQARLTQASLETLAVIAYRQPVSRARVSAVRGVNVDGVVRTLVSRGLIEEAGHEHESGAILYRTTGYFLERLGLTSLDELPPLAEHLPDLSLLDELTEGSGDGGAAS